ncbi:RING-H2 finger protein ATL60 [Platanthera zijinensis]|uniref:RING-type E3 ubiquitin transferase n=1 Tax=Platanthera zijinensis TaxID=2320716 RepID=A0AAP0BTX6_9ASPA
MGDAGNSSSATGINRGAAYKLTSLVMVFAVFLLMLIIFILIIYVYTRRDLSIRSNARRRRWRRSSEMRVRFFISAGNTQAPTTTVGLESSVLSSLPVAVYRASDFKESLECAVCLTDLADGEKFRLLPICSHGFHLECIDMWFHSHNTCPICRCPVVDGRLPDPPIFPAEVSALAAREEMLSISIPVRSAETLLSSSSSILPSRGSRREEMKPPAEEPISPALSKVRSLRRILSRGKKTGGSASLSSPRVADIEMGSGASNGEGG